MAVCRATSCAFIVGIFGDPFPLQIQKNDFRKDAVMPQKLLPMGDQKAGMLPGLAADGQNPRETG